jgi:AraC-like DNA-binding protein
MVDDVRRERALLFAQAGRYNLGEIAVKLGFADTTSLARAFRRWTGTSPSAFLREVRSVPAACSGPASRSRLGH